MFCKFCGTKLDDDALFCVGCGTKVGATKTNINAQPDLDKDNVDNEDSSIETADFVSANVVDVNEDVIVNPAPTEKEIEKKNNKRGKLVKTLCFIGNIVGLVGLSVFLSIVVVCLIIYGRVYLYDGYDYTKVLTTISVIFMMIGLCSVVAKCVLSLAFKIGEFPKKAIKRILLIALAFSCLGFSIWGFASCSKNSNDYSSGSGSSYFSFSSVYYDCGCSYPWADWGADYLSIDTNPYDYDSDSSSSTTYLTVACTAIKKVNTELGLPSYLYQEMLETRAIDGKQYYTGSKVSVSWRYHPDSGLEVRYTKN